MRTMMIFASLMLFTNVALADGKPKDAGVLAPEIAAPKASLPAPVTQPQDMLPILKETVKAARAAKWALMIGMLMMLLTGVFNLIIKDKINRNILPWIAVTLGIVTQISLTLSTGADIVDAIFAGIQAGLTAAGGYSAFGRYLPGLRKGPSAS